MATEDLGVRRIGSTVDYTFATFLKDQSARAAMSSGSVAWYAANGTSAIAAGTTFTSPWSSNTGVHHVQTSMTTTNGFAIDTTYFLRATAGTVDSTDLTGYPFATVRLSGVQHDGALAIGLAPSIANRAIELASGHGIPTVGSVLIVLSAGTDAIGKSRIAGYSGSGNTFNVDPGWNEAGEALPTGPIYYRVYPAPPSTLSSLARVDVEKVSRITLTGSGTTADPWRPA